MREREREREREGKRKRNYKNFRANVTFIVICQLRFPLSISLKILKKQKIDAKVTNH